MGVQGAANNRETEHNAKAAAGQLMLSVLVRDQARDNAAKDILRQAGAVRIETVERTGSETRTA